MLTRKRKRRRSACNISMRELEAERGSVILKKMKQDDDWLTMREEHRAIGYREIEDVSWRDRRSDRRQPLNNDTPAQ